MPVMLIEYLIVFLIALFLSIALVALLKRHALIRFLSKNGMPLSGGICMAASFVIASLSGLFIFGDFYKPVIGIIISSVIMLFFGIIDDLRELSILSKFLVQLICISLLIAFNIKTEIIYIGNLLNIVITFIWVIGITNAFNHLDVMDGITAGAVIIISLGFFTISILNGDIKSAILTLSLTGATFGFLIYNFPPAKIYMGNSGSHFLGFVLAAVALIISYAPLERKTALLSPLLLLGLPIFDTAFLIMMRISKKKLPFTKSNDHLSLRFLALGYSKKQALLIMLSLCLFFSICGIIVSRASNPVGITVIIIVIILSLVFGSMMSRIVIRD